MRINYESWWNAKHPEYPFTMLTEIFDPCKVQAEMPKVDFISVGVLSEDRPTMRIWGFKFVSDMRRFATLIEQKRDLLRVDVSR